MSEQDDQLPEDEIARRMEGSIRRFLKTPPQPHGKNPRAAPPPPRVKERPASKRRAGKRDKPR
jgi:hypothetical protein